MASKLTVHLSDEVAEALRETAERRGISVSHAVVRAISLDAFIQSELDKGGQFLVKTKGDVQEVEWD